VFDEVLVALYSSSALTRTRNFQSRYQNNQFPYHSRASPSTPIANRKSDFAAFEDQK
jgi:hypothetical protein